jgi:hypothetical protein
MLMMGIKFAAGGLLIFWAVEAIAFIAHLARIGMFRAVRDDRRERTQAFN